MKTSNISTSSLENALRYTRLRAQDELAQAMKESTTGRLSDIGLALGAKTSRSVDLNSELQRIDGLKATNSIATSRLSASQGALAAISKNGQTILNTLVGLSGNVDANSIATMTTTMKSAFASFTSLANTSFNGEYLFSGINTDVKPLKDYNDPAGSTAKANYNAALSTFLAAQTPPLTDISQMNGTQMDDFISNSLQPMFTGASWNPAWSDATDQNMTSRVTRGEVVDTSTNANTDGFRKMAFVSVLVTEVLSKTLSPSARQAATGKAQTIVGEAITGIDAQRTRLGLSESRIKQVNETLDGQKDIIENHLNGLEGVDPVEARTRVTALSTLVETSYAMTAKILQMSLLNYLK